MTYILSHGDGDGICGAAIAKMVPKYSNCSVIFTHPMGLAKDLLGIEDNIIVIDIAIDERKYNEIYNFYEMLTSQGYSIIHIDHHSLPGPLPEKVILIHEENISATELTYRFFYNQLPSHADHFACIGAICDYMDDTPVIQELMIQYERRALFLDAGILSQGLNAIRNNYEYKRKLVEQFANGLYPCEFKGLANKAIRVSREDKLDRKVVISKYEIMKNFAYIVDPNASKSKSAHWIMADSNKLIGLTINTRKKKKMVDISVRGRRLLDLRKIIPPIAKALGGSAGGHSNAVGSRIPKERIQEFLNKLDKEIDKLNIEKPPRIENLVDF